MTTLTLSEISTHLAENGLRNRVRGDDSVQISGCNTLEAAGRGDLTFLANPKYRDRVATTGASAIIMREDETIDTDRPRILCDDPYRGLTMAVIKLHGFRSHPDWGISDQAWIDESATVGSGANVGPGVTICRDAQIGVNVVLYPGVFIGPGCRIGHDCLLYANVVLYDGCRLGNRVTIHAGSVIGEDGLGYAPVDKKWVKIPQAGAVMLEDDVEIGANCTIDRATLGTTRIGAGTKFSNLIAIGHGCQIGPDCMFVAQAGLAGSVNVGRHVTIAGQAGIVGHLSIGDEASICAQAGVNSNVSEREMVLGSPAIPVAEARRAMVAAQKLPDMIKKVRALEREVNRLRKQLQGTEPQPNPKPSPSA